MADSGRVKRTLTGIIKGTVEYFQSIFTTSLSSNQYSTMTSQPLRLDSAEHSSALSEGQSGAAETEAVNILSQISKGIPVPSVHPSPQHSVPYGLPLHPGNAIQSSSRVQPSKISECQPSSVGARPTKTRETRVVKRLAARSSKNAHQMPLSPTGTYKLPDPLEFRSSGPPLSFHNRQPACAFFPSNPSMVTRRPVSAPSEYPDTPFDLSAYSSRPPRPSSSTSSIPSIGSPNLGLRSSFGLHHGPPGIPVLPPVNEILPAATQIMPNTGPSSFQPPPLQYSVEVNGYMIIRNAIHVGLIRSVAEIIREGLPVSGRSEMAQTYVPPIQAYEVRDEFILVSSSTTFSTNVPTIFFPRTATMPSAPSTNQWVGIFPKCRPPTTLAPSRQASRRILRSRSSIVATTTSSWSTLL